MTIVCTGDQLVVLKATKHGPFLIGGVLKWNV